MSDSDNMLMDQEALTVRQPKVRHWVWFGLAVATVGFVAVLSNSFKPRHSALAMRIAHGHSLMRAFTDRVLAAQANHPDYTSSAHLLINEAGAEAPSAMTIISKLTQVEHPDPVAFLRVKAKEGKEADLQTQMTELLNETFKLLGQEKGEDAADVFRKHVGVLEPDNGHVVIKVLDPDPIDFSEMEEDFTSGPEFHLNLSFGCGLTEMMKKKEAHFPVALKGVGVDGSLAFSGAILKDLGDVTSRHGMPPNMLEVASVMVSESTSLELLYRPDGNFKSLPKVQDLTEFLGMILSQFPQEFLDKLAGLDELIDGVTSFKMGALPGKHRLEVDFNNFHIAPMLKDIIDNMPPKQPMMWS